MKYFPRLTTLQILQKIQDKLDTCSTSPEEFEDRIICMSMCNDIDWTKDWDISLLSVLVKKRYGTQRYKVEGKWNDNAVVMVSNFRRKRTSCLQGFHCIGSRILEKERWEMYDSLQCGSFECRSFISHQ